MEVILMENVENLGSVGDKVNVKSGFARNYLVPHGKAKMATAANLAEFEAIRAELEKAAADARQAAEARKQEIEALGAIEITARVGSEGKLFGPSVSPTSVTRLQASVATSRKAKSACLKALYAPSVSTLSTSTCIPMSILR